MRVPMYSNRCDRVAGFAVAFVLAFVLVHKIGDTVCQLSVRLFYNDLGFTKEEVAGVNHFLHIA